MGFKTILIIDDDDMLRTSLAKGLRTNGFDVITAESAEHGAEILARVLPDAIILDRMMGGRDGVTALREWRAHGIDIPVLMLTALSGPENTIVGLDVGADDYLSKPFSLAELVLRLNNIMRRSGVNAPASSLPDGMTQIDGEFFINNKLFGLSVAEKELLTILLTPVGNIASAAPMVAKRLREKIRANVKNIDIITVRGRGYKLVCSLQSAECN